MPPVSRGRRRRPAASRPPTSQGPTQYLAIGEVLTSHGVHGDIRMRILTDFPERFKTLKRAYLGEEHELCEVEKARLLPDRVLIKLSGIETPEVARAHSGQLLYVPVSEAMPLGEGQFYWYQIIGLTAVTPDGQTLGQVKDILPTGSNDVYVVTDGTRELLIPAIEDVVIEVDLAAGKIVVQPMPDME